MTIANMIKQAGKEINITYALNIKFEQTFIFPYLNEIKTNNE